MPSARSRRFALLVLLALAFVLRVGWSVSRPADDAFVDSLPDQREYLSLAQNLLAGEGLQFFDPRFRDALYAFRPPLYPAFIAACGGRPRLVQVAQAGIDVSTALAAFLLARALLKPEAARGVRPLLAAALVAFNPFMVYFSATLLTETLSAALLAWGMALLVLGACGGTPRDPTTEDAPTPAGGKRFIVLWLVGGLLLALAGLARPSAIPLAVLLGYAAALAHANRTPRDPYRKGGRGFPRGWPLPVGATMLLLTVIVLFPWAWRNSRVVKRWVWTTTNGGVTLYDGFHPDATGASDQSFLKHLPQLRDMGEVGRSDYLGERARQFIQEHPDRALQLAAIKAGRTWSPVPLSQEYGGWRNRAIGLLYAGPLYVLVLLGLAGEGLTRSAKALLLLPAAYFTVVHMASVGSLRYRIPAEPPMAVVAAAALASGAGHWRRATGFPVVEGSPETAA